MLRDVNDTDMSEMEREFELEMEEDDEPVDDEDLEEEFENLVELEMEEADEPVDDEDLEEEFESLMELEMEEELENEFDENEPEEEYGDFADRFYEISLEMGESELEIDAKINSLLSEMEREYLFGSLFRRIRKAKEKIEKGVKRAARGGLGRLVRRVAGRAMKGIPGIQVLKGITQLSGGNLRGLLAALAKVGLSSAIPGGGIAVPAALQALGFREVSDPEENREAWSNFTEVAMEAFDHLAGTLNERADDPVEANRLATDAFQTALRKHQIRAPRVGSRKKKTRIIELRKGQRIVIQAE